MGNPVSVPIHPSPLKYQAEGLDKALDDVIMKEGFDGTSPIPLQDLPSKVTLDKLMHHMRFFQNTETSDFVFVAGMDDIDNVPKINRDEWIEINISGLQDEYVQQKLRSKIVTERRFFGGDIVSTASLSTVTAPVKGVAVPVTDVEYDVINEEENCDSSKADNDIVANENSSSSEQSGASERSVSNVSNENISARSSDTPIPTQTPTQSTSLTVSSSSSKKSTVPNKCPFCDHIFANFENTKKHISACRQSDERDACLLGEWVDKISLNNQDAMREIMMEAMSVFEIKTSHRENVQHLLKRLQIRRTCGTIEQLEELHLEMSMEVEELKQLIVPLKSKGTVNVATSSVIRDNDEINDLIRFLGKGMKILERKIASKSRFSVEDLAVGKVLNSGSFSSVHVAKCRESGELYALKVIKREFLREQKLEHQVERECRVLEQTSLYPDMFLKLHFHDIRDDYIFMLMEYVPTGDCWNLMKSMGGKLPKDLAKHIIANLVKSVSFLHLHGVVHRDIKPDNLLITPQGHVKLVDFGMCNHHSCNNAESDNSLWLEALATGNTTTRNAKSSGDFSLSSFMFGDNAEGCMKTLVGNVNYAAPEVLEGDGYDHSVDWWAVGVLYYHFLDGAPPFQGMSDSETKFNVIQGLVDWKNCPKSCRPFISSLLMKNPKRRLGSKGSYEVVEHKHFNDIDFSQVFAKPGPYIPAVKPFEFKEEEVDFLV